jgi:hypothetical protein
MRRVRLLVMLVVLVAAWTAVFRVLVGNPAMSGLRVPDGMPNSEALNAAADTAREAAQHEFFLASLPQVIPLYVVGLVLIVGSVVLVRRAMDRRRSR